MSPLDESKQGLELLKNAITGFLKLQSNGATNAEIADALKLRSHHEGKQKDYLTYSVLGLLIEEGRISYQKIPGHKVYFFK